MAASGREWERKGARMKRKKISSFWWTFVFGSINFESDFSYKLKQILSFVGFVPIKCLRDFLYNGGNGEKSLYIN